MHNFSLSGGQLSVVKRLLEIPEVLNNMERKNNNGQTGLDIAIEEGHTEVAETIRAAKRLRYQGESYATEVSEKDTCVCSAFTFSPPLVLFCRHDINL